MPTPTRFPGGLNNSNPSATLSQYGLPDPSKWHTYFNDFDTYVAADWTITTVGSGTRALGALDGGVLVVTNSAADDDSNFFDKVGSSFLLEAGKKAFFKARFKVNDATQSDFVMGLQVTDTTPLDVTDGIYFLKSDGSAALSVICRKDATTGSTSASNIFTVLDDTYMILGWYYDGKGSLAYFVNGAQMGTLDASASFLPDSVLTVSFGVQNGEAVAKVLSTDYILAAKER